MGGADGGDLASRLPTPVANFVRSGEFFGRVGVIYGSYKLTQARELLARAQGRASAEAVAALWDAQHTWAGEAMYDLCISLRGFYLKAGQFIGARADFVPEQICRKLCLLQDRVPPMSAERARKVVCEELGIDDLSEVFEWIDLDEPIGSASISQVHKARLRRFKPEQLRRLARRERGLLAELAVQPGDTAWSICNSHGISLAELGAANRQADLEALQPGQRLRVPVVLGLEHFQQQQTQAQQQRHQPGGAHGGRSAWLGLGGLLGGGGSGGSGGSGGRLPGQQQREEQQQRREGSSSQAAGSRGGAGAGASSSSSSEADNSSSDPLEAGSSLLAAGQPLGQGGHLLQLVAGGSRRARSSTALAGWSDSGASSSGDSSSGSSGGRDGFLPEVHSPAAAAVAHAAASGSVPGGGLVAVKIQYPGALATMTLDLVNLRSVSAFLQKTELKFDLLSAVSEMQRQIHLEFDFMREARVMDTIAQHLSRLSSRVAVPRSVPGLVSRRLMVMSFMDGLPLLQLRDKVAHLPAWKRQKAARRILGRVAEAYGLMILGEGLFQADGHPGNILVQPGGRVALLDYGQSKQLGEEDKAAFADLVLAMHGGDEAAISAALSRLAVTTSKDDVSLRAQMAYGMFDTRGKVDPFDSDSPIKKGAIEAFPPDLFFVLRVVQLLRGMAMGMGVEDFSTADQWAPLAKAALAKADKRRKKREAQAALQGRLRTQPLLDLAAIASPLRLTV